MSAPPLTGPLGGAEHEWLAAARAAAADASLVARAYAVLPRLLDAAAEAASLADGHTMLLLAHPHASRGRRQQMRAARRAAAVKQREMEEECRQLGAFLRFASGQQSAPDAFDPGRIRRLAHAA